MATKLIIRYEGEFDFQGLYELIGNFFRSRRYDFYEKKLKNKDATPAGKEITYQFVAEKNVNEYVKYTYKIDWKSADVAKTADTSTFARMHIHVTWDLDLDWQEYEKQTPWLKRIYQEYIINMEIEDIHYAEIGMEAQTLIDSINDFLGMMA